MQDPEFVLKAIPHLLYVCLQQPSQIRICISIFLFLPWTPSIDQVPTSRSLAAHTPHTDLSLPFGAISSLLQSGPVAVLLDLCSLQHEFVWEGQTPSLTFWWWQCGGACFPHHLLGLWSQERSLLWLKPTLLWSYKQQPKVRPFEFSWTAEGSDQHLWWILKFVILGKPLPNDDDETQTPSLSLSPLPVEKIQRHLTRILHWARGEFSWVYNL